jgi:hypothetical protein
VLVPEEREREINISLNYPICKFTNKQVKRKESIQGNARNVILEAAYSPSLGNDSKKKISGSANELTPQ